MKKVFGASCLGIIPRYSSSSNDSWKFRVSRDVSRQKEPVHRDGRPLAEGRYWMIRLRLGLCNLITVA